MTIAERVGNWPLLLSIVKGVLQERVRTVNQPPLAAINYVNKALDKRGLTAFDQATPRHEIALCRRL